MKGWLVLGAVRLRVENILSVAPHAGTTSQVIVEMVNGVKHVFTGTTMEDVDRAIEAEMYAEAS